MYKITYLLMHPVKGTLTRINITFIIIYWSYLIYSIILLIVISVQVTRAYKFSGNLVNEP